MSETLLQILHMLPSHAQDGFTCYLYFRNFRKYKSEAVHKFSRIISHVCNWKFQLKEIKSSHRGCKTQRFVNGVYIQQVRSK